jgi:hypothetical protein
MKDLKRRGLLVLVLLSAGAMSIGCSSTGSTGGTGGSSASGGSGGHGGAGGAARMCGSAADAGGMCQAAPCDGVIASDFSTPDAAEIMYGLTTWGPGPFIKPTYSTDGSALNVSTDVPPAAGPQYLGTTLYFNSCLDASFYSGVQFTISGSITGCELVFGVNDIIHDDHASDSKGTCDAGSNCYAPNMVVAMPVTSSPTVMQIPWITAGGSVPNVPLNTSQLVGVQWQFNIAPTPDGGTPENCTAQVQIKDVKFYH